MLIRSESLISMAPADSPERALEHLAGLLERHGLASPALAEAFAERDRAFPCLLDGVAVPHLGPRGEPLARGGGGIAIPHSGPLDDHLVLNGGGVAALRPPRPFLWNGTPVSLVVALALPRAAQAGAFAAVASLASRPGMLEALAAAQLPSDLMTLLNAQDPCAADRPPGLSAKRTHDAEIAVRLCDLNGMHARPAARLSALAARFTSDVSLLFAGRAASVRSVGAMMGLGIGGPADLVVAATGPDAAEAAACVADAIARGLDGDAAGEPAAPDLSALPTFAPSAFAILGIAASPGIGIGPLFKVKDAAATANLPESGQGAEAETGRLREALAAASRQLEALAAGMERTGEGSNAEIFRAHKALLADGELARSAESAIRSGKSAAFAWNLACEEAGRLLGRSGNARLAARSADYRDIAGRVLALLLPGVAAGAPRWPDRPFIVVARDLTPSQTASLPRERVLGIVTAEGGPTAHTAILARAMGIPAVVAAGDSVLELPEDGSDCIVNGVSGFLETGFMPEVRARAEAAAAEFAERAERLHAERLAVARSRDGHAVEVAANIASAEEASSAVAAGADGIGLLRTEIMVQECRDAPSEAWLVERFAEVAAALGGKPILVRTYDIGGDKPVPFLPMEREGNPFLGVRGIRLCLAHPDAFRTLLRAILRAVRDHALRAKIMLPMVTFPAELARAKEMIRAEAGTLGMPCPPVGIMVEVPAVLWRMDEFAKEADFFSIGTNDLTQYLLAMDRQHPKLASQADPLDPAVLRAIGAAVEGAKRSGRFIGVCGNLASDPVGAAILFGLGVDELSVAAPAIAATKALIRGCAYRDARRLAREALACGTAAEVRALYRA